MDLKSYFLKDENADLRLFIESFDRSETLYNYTLRIEETLSWNPFREAFAIFDSIGLQYLDHRNNESACATLAEDPYLKLLLLLSVKLRLAKEGETLNAKEVYCQFCQLSGLQEDFPTLPIFRTCLNQAGQTQSLLKSKYFYVLELVRDIINGPQEFARELFHRSDWQQIEMPGTFDMWDFGLIHFFSKDIASAKDSKAFNLRNKTPHEQGAYLKYYLGEFFNTSSSNAILKTLDSFLNEVTEWQSWNDDVHVLVLDSSAKNISVFGRADLNTKLSPQMCLLLRLLKEGPKTDIELADAGLVKPKPKEDEIEAPIHKSSGVRQAILSTNRTLEKIQTSCGKAIFVGFQENARVNVKKKHQISSDYLLIELHS